MSATDELRRLLDERGVKWMPSVWSAKDETFYKVGEVGYLATEMSSGRMKVGVEGYLAPEQAIEATLGRGECRDKGDGTVAFKCSECGCWVAYDEDWSTGLYAWVDDKMKSIFPHYCPNCGRRVRA